MHDGIIMAALAEDEMKLVFGPAVAEPPTLTGISPAIGAMAGGDTVTLTGTGFAAGATVTFGGSSATDVTVVSSTEITCKTPAGSAGSVDVIVTNMDKQSATLAGGFAYVIPTSYDNSLGKGNRVGSITVTANFTLWGSGGNVYIDGVTASGNTWFPGQVVTNMALQFDFGSARVVTEMKWYQSDNTAQGTWRVEGSNDGSTFTPVSDSFALGGATQQVINGALFATNATAYRYYRLRGISGSTPGTCYNHEVEFKID